MNKAQERGQPTVGALTVPYMVNERNRPIDFKAVDPDHVDRCAKHRRCGVCGGKIRGAGIAFIGPDDGRTCFADPWMHPDCGRLAMAQCPFLAGRRDWRGEDARALPLLAPYSAGMVLYLATDGRSHRDQLGHWHFEAVAPIWRDE